MKPSLSAQIYTLLLQNTKGENAFMTYDDLGHAIFGQGFGMKNYHSDMVKQLKNAMAVVQEIAFANGHSIVPSRKLTKAKNRTFMVTGWKIPMQGNEKDAEYVVNELFYKQTNGKIKEESFKRFKNINLANNVISDNQLKHLHLNQ